VPAMDATGLYALEKIYENLNRNKIALIISGARAQPRGVMQKAGFIDRIGLANMAPDIEWAIVRCYELLGPEARNRPTGHTVKVLAPKHT
jgi:sulfate permease, SulP family